MTCLIVSNDLMWSSQAAEAARQAGLEFATLLNAVDMANRCQSEDVTHVLVDMSDPQLDPQQLQADLKGTGRSDLTVLAVGPHVHVERLSAARQAGWTVMTRGQFHTQRHDLMQAWAST